MRKIQWKEGMYLLFASSVGKITHIGKKKVWGGLSVGEKDRVSIRKCSYGKTEEGYTYQSHIKMKNLDKMYSVGKVKFMARDDFLRALLNYFIKNIPQENKPFTALNPSSTVEQAVDEERGAHSNSFVKDNTGVEQKCRQNKTSDTPFKHSEDKTADTHFQFECQHPDDPRWKEPKNDNQKKER